MFSRATIRLGIGPHSSCVKINTDVNLDIDLFRIFLPGLNFKKTLAIQRMKSPIGLFSCAVLIFVHFVLDGANCC